jgi:cardiolipin synthase A/B
MLSLDGPFLYQVSLYLFMGLSAFHALLHKRDSRAALAWIVVCFLFSGVGALFYWLLGVNRVKTRARELQLRGHWDDKNPELHHDSGHLLRAGHRSRKALEALIPIAERVTRRPLMVGNRIRMFENGEEAYPAMLDAIRKAKKSIQLATYIFDDDSTGAAFVEALRAARERGVEVRVLVDGQGIFYSKGRILSRLKAAGIRSARFLPLTNPFDTLHLNLRNHRKLLIVDSRIGFTGGMNIGNRHLVETRGGGERVRDLHFGFEGPLIGEFQDVFIEDWYFATRETLPRIPYPSGPLPGRAVCRGIADGPNEDFEKLNWILMGVLSWARKSVKIMTPYFVPSRELISALNMASLRGVRIEILIPGKNNHPWVDWACRAYLWEMLQKGVRFYEQPAPFVHSKMLVADGMYALVGSGNLDNRSLRLNFEFNVEVYEPWFARNLEKHFERSKRMSRILTLAEMDGQPLWMRARNRVAKLASPFL